MRKRGRVTVGEKGGRVRGGKWGGLKVWKRGKG